MRVGCDVKRMLAFPFPSHPSLRHTYPSPGSRRPVGAVAGVGSEVAPRLCSSLSSAFGSRWKTKPSTWSLMTQHVTGTQVGGGGVVNGERVVWVGDGCEEGQVAWNTIFSNNVSRIFPITKSAAENIQLLWESKSERAITTLHYTLSHPLFSTPPAPPPLPPTPSTPSADANPKRPRDLILPPLFSWSLLARDAITSLGEGRAELSGTDTAGWGCSCFCLSLRRSRAGRSLDYRENEIRTRTKTVS